MKTKIKIEKNVPMSPHGNTKYPVDKMEIGDSFFIPAMKRFGARGVYASAKIKNIKITMRKEGNGYRVWRIA